MAKSSKRKKREARNSVVKLIACVGAVIFFIGLIIANSITLSESNSELDQRKVILQDIEKDNKEMSDDIKNGNSLSFIEQLAKKLGYAYSDEHVHEDGTPNGNN